MWFFNKNKKENEKKVEYKNNDVFFNAFADLDKNKEDIKFDEPMTFAKARLEQGAQDFGYKKASSRYKSHKTKIQNQWINPLQSVNSGFGNAQNSFYNYQSVNYYECYSLAQDPLFNKIFNILSKTPFANGGNVVAEFDDKQKETFENSVTKFDVYGKFVKALRSTYVCGGCLLLMDFGQTDYEEPLDLKKMNMKKFRGFIQIDPINLVAIDVNTVNPAKSDYMKPKVWYVVGLGSVHASHFLKFEDNLPELIMRPMTLYFGMPLTLLIKQDVANSNLASQGLANMMNRFRYLYMKTGQENFTSDSAINFRQRLEAMSMVQDNFGVYPIKDTEDMFQLTTSLTGMNDNAEFFYQVIASKTDITLSILLGKGAQGLSGTLEGERKNFYDRMRAEQEMVKPNLLIALGIVYGWATDGKFVEFTDYLFNPLEQSDEREKAENMRSYTEVAGKLIEMGVKNEDVLDWLKQFRDFNLENVEFDADAQGLEEYDDMGDYTAKEEGQRQFNGAFEDKVAFVMREFEAGKLKDSHGNIVKDKDKALAIAYSEAKEKVINAEFKESDHPRDKSGQFIKKGSGESGDKKSSKEEKKETEKGSQKELEGFVDFVQKEEPKITKDVTDEAKNQGVTNFGLDFRLKTKQSALRKANADYVNGEFNSPKEALSNMFDLVRYTQLGNTKNLVSTGLKTLDNLQKKGHRVYKIKNTFMDENNPYKGVNVKMISPEGVKYELQFNTEKNIEIKEEMHKIYEKAREIGISEELKKKYQKQMFELGKKFEKVDEIEKFVYGSLKK